MAEIDVTDISLDPFLAGDRFVVVRRKQVMTTAGIATEVIERFQNLVGSIQPTGENSLVRDEAYSDQVKSITVVSTFRLRGVSETVDGVQYQPDLVLWQGNYFIVKEIKDWTKFGGGMVEADCSSFQFVDAPPGNPSGTPQ